MAGAVEVITTTEGGSVPPVDAGLSVVTEVIRTIEGVGEGGTADEGGPRELVAGLATIDGGAMVDEGGRTKELD